MIYSIQNASLWKRMSALLLDFIILLILTTGFAFVISLITNYSYYDEELHKCYDQYEEEYGCKIDISSSEYEALSEEEQQKYQDMFAALNADENVLYFYNTTINLTMVIVSIGVFLAVLIAEFVVPLFLKNGQTLGKKIFAIGVVKNNSVRITHLQLFIRSILGKYAIELMVPILLTILILVGHGNLIIILLLFGILIFQTMLCIFTKNRQPIHDILAYTVVVDMQTQMIFDSEAELLEYKKNNHLEEVNNSK